MFGFGPSGQTMQKIMTTQDIFGDEKEKNRMTQKELGHAEHGVLTDDVVRTKALELATKMGITFQASAN
jgi:hypothetical protein